MKLFRFIRAGLLLGADVRVPTQDGIVYGIADGEQLTMDYYAPRGSGPHPIAVIVHGGSYIGDTSKNGKRGILRRLFGTCRLCSLFDQLSARA